MDVSSVTQRRELPESGCTVAEFTAKEQFLAGLILFFVVFAFWMTFSSFCVSFYRDDNVIFSGPLLIEAARQVKNGHLPLWTFLVGGGGGTPLLTVMQPGALNVLTLVPALFLESQPQTMTNVIVSLHLGLFAWGGWYLATVLRAPVWACLVAALSLGFSGCMTIQTGAWIAIFMPYAFLPWMLGGLIRLSEAQSRRDILVAHAVTGWATLSMFWSGAPTAGFYSFLPACCCLAYVLVGRWDKWKTLIIRGLPQVILFLVAVAPLLWKAKAVYDYYGREHSPLKWIELSVPLQAYLGLFIPQTYSLWQHVGTMQLFTNVYLLCGAVPAWFVAFGVYQKPSVLKLPKILCLLVGLVLFVPIMSSGCSWTRGVLCANPHTKHVQMAVPRNSCIPCSWRVPFSRHNHRGFHAKRKTHGGGACRGLSDDRRMVRKL